MNLIFLTTASIACTTELRVMKFSVLVLLVLMGTGTYSMPTEVVDQTGAPAKPTKQPAGQDTAVVVGRIMSEAFAFQIDFHGLDCEVIFESSVGTGIKRCYDGSWILTCFEQQRQCFVTGSVSAKKAAGAPQHKDKVTVLGRAFDTPFALELAFDEVQDCETVYVSGNGSDIKRCYDPDLGVTLYCFEQVNQCYLTSVDENAGIHNGVS
ncbi:hypothetical protein Bbelb_214030 [Branchiostoma belcheri]|nr:hypothetical protein Bbelb_214030 [Branchiostoma belcheri]